MESPSRFSEPSRRRKILFYGIVFSLMVAIPFLVTEAYLRVRFRNVDLWEKTGRGVSRNPVAEWGLVDAFCAYRGRPGEYSGAEKTVNRDGFISTPEILPAKPAGTLRIAFLGGSSTAGTGKNLSDESTWPWRTVEILKDQLRDQDVEFVNGALGGYTSFESYGRLWSRIRFYSPDVVVLYQGWNEMYYFNRVDAISRWRTHSDGSWSFDRTSRIVGTHRPFWIDHLARHSQVLTRLRLFFGQQQEGEIGPASEASTYLRGTPPTAQKAVVSRRIRAQPVTAAYPSASVLQTEPYDRRALEIWRTNLRLFRETSKALGIKLFVAKQATLIVPDLPPEERERCRYDLHGFGHEEHVAAFAAIYRVIDEEISVKDVIDATPLSGRPEYFHDHVHLTEEGAHELAHLVAAEILAYLEGHGSYNAPKR